MYSAAPKPRFIDLFTPKLVTVFREGYRATHFRSDVVAGLTVAIVALPLSMAIAIASGVAPERGLYAAIFGGLLVSMLGGSRFQIGGPAGAFIVLVAATVGRHGVDGLILATLLSGCFLLVLGFLRVGTFIKFVPYPVTIGFTAGIAVIIFLSQVSPLLGLTVSGAEPGPVLDKLPVLFHALPTVSWQAALIAAFTVTAIFAVRHFAPKWPGMLIAITVAGAAQALFDLPVATIGSKFGGIPSAIPLPMLPELSFAHIQAVLPDAVAFTLLGAIESLLSAVVADGMTGRRHRSNCEVVAQGFANIGSSLFGGMCVTGTIARTATNVRAGAHGPVAGIVHSIFLLLFVLVAAPLAQFIPLAALAGILVTVAWSMAERHAFWTLLRGSRGDAVVLLATFGLTVFRDLTEAIIVGFALGSVLFIHRMSEATSVHSEAALVGEDIADVINGPRAGYDEADASDPDVMVHRIRGALFFGAATVLDVVLDRAPDRPRVLVIDFTEAPFVDSSGAHSIEGVVRKAHRPGTHIYISGATPEERGVLQLHGVQQPLVHYVDRIDDALIDWRRIRSRESSVAP